MQKLIRITKVWRSEKYSLRGNEKTVERNNARENRGNASENALLNNVLLLTAKPNPH